MVHDSSYFDAEQFLGFMVSGFPEPLKQAAQNHTKAQTLFPKGSRKGTSLRAIQLGSFCYKGLLLLLLPTTTTTAATTTTTAATTTTTTTTAATTIIMEATAEAFRRIFSSFCTGSWALQSSTGPHGVLG